MSVPARRWHRRGDEPASVEHREARPSSVLEDVELVRRREASASRAEAKTATRADRPFPISKSNARAERSRHGLPSRDTGA
jgi:hypothetical protein